MIAIYVRRRIGKTHLVREFYADHFIYNFTGLRNGSRPDQIENFMIELNSVSDKFLKEQPENWLQALNLCEIKFCNDTYTVDADYAKKLRNKESQ